MLRVALLATTVAAGCGPAKVTLPCEARVVERLPVEVSAGFDDFSSPGAALGFAVDVQRQLGLVVAARFELPVYQQVLHPLADALETVQGYPRNPPPDAVGQAAAEYEDLHPLLTDTAGVRSMPGELTAFVVDLGEDGPAWWVATDGELLLTREEDPRDEVEGWLLLEPVDGPDEDAAPSGGGECLRLASVRFGWDTRVQP